MTTNQNNSPTLKRLLTEYKNLMRSPEPDFVAAPCNEDLFVWHFTIKGPKETPFQGGLYHGKIIFPGQYPLAPPDIYFLTPNGRFEINKKICLTITSFHPDQWNPAWDVRTALLSIIAFMPTNANGAIGGINETDEVRRNLALESHNWHCPDCSLTIEPDLIPDLLTENNKQNQTEQNQTDKNQTEQNQTEKNKTELNKTDKNQTDKNQTEQNQIELNKAEKNQIEINQEAINKIGQNLNQDQDQSDGQIIQNDQALQDYTNNQTVMIPNSNNSIISTEDQNKENALSEVKNEFETKDDKENSINKDKDEEDEILVNKLIEEKAEKVKNEEEEEEDEEEEEEEEEQVERFEFKEVVLKAKRGPLSSVPFLDIPILIVVLMLFYYAFTRPVKKACFVL